MTKGRDEKEAIYLAQYIEVLDVSRLAVAKSDPRFFSD